MDNATLGLELEYCNFKVELEKKDKLDSGGKIDEADFKSRHIIVTEGNDKVKKLFSCLRDYGIKVTLDTRSRHDELKGKVQLTVELVLDHEKFEIKAAESENSISLSKDFAGHVDKFSKYIIGERPEDVLEIKFEGKDEEIYELKIPSYKGNRMLMPHVTIPCPLCKISDSYIASACVKDWNEIPEYSVEYLKKILNSLKVCLVQTGRPLTPEEIKEIEKHDPKQSYHVIPKTSFNAIFNMIMKVKIYRDCLSDMKEKNSDYYITPEITFNSLIDEIIKNGEDLLKDSLIGIGSIGPKIEIIREIECPIFEFRRIGSFEYDKIYSFEDQLIKDLTELYFVKSVPINFKFVK